MYNTRVKKVAPYAANLFNPFSFIIKTNTYDKPFHS